MRARNALLLGAGAAAGAAAVAAARRSRVEHPPLLHPDAGERAELAASDGATLVVEVVGPDDGPPVVLAHCWGGHVETWGPVAARLVDRGHRVVRWHQRGHGPSTVGEQGFAIERFGADLAEVVDHLDVRGAVVAGHSLGGMTTQAFAAHHPEVAADRARALVLVATSSRVDQRLRRSAPGGGDALHRRAAVLDRALASRSGHLLVRGALGKGASPHAVRATRDHFVGTPLATRLGILQAMQEMDLRQRRREIDLPATVVVGTRDTLTPASHSRSLAADLPDARLVTVPGAGHMLPFEAPDLLADLIEEHHR